MTKMLLHACCGPCSLEPSRLLLDEGTPFSIFFSNSNIHPQEEYELRLATIREFQQSQGVGVIEGEYNRAAWDMRVGVIGEKIVNLQHELGLDGEIIPSPNPYPLPVLPDGFGENDEVARADGVDARGDNGNCKITRAAWSREFATKDEALSHLAELRQTRCRACYRLRFEETCSYAKEYGFDAVGTTLSVSPYQYTNIIREELERACKNAGLTCAFVDYRPYFETNEARSKELGMYRQNYCGCHFSYDEAQAERAYRKKARKAAKAAKKAAKLAQQHKP